MAARLLHPAPTDFTANTDLSVERMRQSIKHGRPNSAMMAFAQRLSAADVDAVITYIRQRFINAGDNKVPILYHSEQNGWPKDHAKYNAPAVPFATGDMPLDTPDHLLTEQQRAGKRLYMASCISCHDQSRVMQQGDIWRGTAVSYPRPENFKVPPNNDKAEVDAVTGATPYAPHDEAPKLDSDDPLLRQGESLFQRNCAFCHAADGSGRNWIGRFLQPHPADLSRRRDLTIAKLQTVIRRGVPGTTMPAWQSVLNEQQIMAVSAYVYQVLKTPDSPNVLDSAGSGRHSENP